MLQKLLSNCYCAGNKHSSLILGKADRQIQGSHTVSKMKFRDCVRHYFL